MPWISKKDFSLKLHEARNEGIRHGEKKEFERNAQSRKTVEYRIESNKREMQEEWVRFHEEKRIFEEYKSTEFLKMCKEMNWKIS